MVVSALDGTDILANPPAEHKYETIKNKIIAEFTDSQERQIRKLINELELGDKKPSQLLRQMKTLAARQITDDVLKTLWLCGRLEVCNQLYTQNAATGLAVTTRKPKEETP